MTGFNSKRQMAQAKLDEDDDTQVYSDTLLIVYQRGFVDGKRSAQQQAEPVREMLFALQDRIDALEAQKLQDRNAMDAMKLANGQWSVQCRQLEKQLAVQTYAADNYRRLLDESDHAYAALREKLAEPMTEVVDRFAHRMALEVQICNAGIE